MTFIFQKALKALMIGVVGFGLFAVPAAAQDAEAEAFVQSVADDATALLNDETLDEQAMAQQFQTLFVPKTAVRQFGRSALGAYSRTTSDEDFDNYVALLEQYAMSVVAANLGEYSGEEITVTGSEVDERSNYDYVSVESDVINQRGDRLAGVRWLLIRREGEYRIYDITVEAPAEEGTFSLLQTQREEFSSVIANNNAGIAPLMGYLRERIREAGMEPSNTISQ